MRNSELGHSSEKNEFENEPQEVVSGLGSGPEKITERQELKVKIRERLEPIIKNLEDSVTEDGLVPEIGERGKREWFDRGDGKWKQYIENEFSFDKKDVKFGYNSELLGYSLRLAVEDDNRKLFEKLIKGMDAFKMNNGLLRSRIHPDKKPDNSIEEVWADANQDTALALIEAGERWNNKEFIHKGEELASSFINSNQVVKIGDKLSVFSSYEHTQTIISGERVRGLDMSMFNFKLYETMQNYSEDKRWGELVDSGLSFINESLDKYELPPNRLLIIDGEVLSYEDARERLLKDEELLNSIPNPIMKKQFVNAIIRPEYSWDAMRIPYRLNDSKSIQASKLSGEIFKRINVAGGPRTMRYADNGEECPGKSEVAAVATSPLATNIAKEFNSWGKAIDQIDESTVDADKEVLYWQLWRGLSLAQLERNFSREIQSS